MKTRSQKDAGSTEENNTTEESSAATGTTTDSATDATATTESTATTQAHNMGDERSKPKESQKTQEAENINMTGAAGKKATSVASSKTGRRRAELEAKLELQRLKLEMAQAAAEHTATKLQLLRLDGQEDTDLSEDEDTNRQRVVEWVESSSVEKRGNPLNPGTKRRKEDVNKGEEPKEAPPTTSSNGALSLANAIIEAIKSNDKQSATAPKYLSELHPFDGDLNEWMAFRTTYADTARHFSDVQNVSRLRRSIQGRAREAVKALLYTQTDPAQIITALERRFGRPTYLIKNEIANIDKLPTISENAKEIVRFAGVVSNTVATIKKMNKPNFLHSSDISDRIIEKMSTIIRFKWFEYHFANDEDPILEALAKFLNTIADQFEAYDTHTRTQTKREGNPRVRRTYAAKPADSSDEEANATIAFQKQTRESCPVCNRDHSLKECQSFIKAKLDDRWEMIKKSNACFKCLKSGRHRGFNCKAKGCAKCKGRHHTLLHTDRNPTTMANAQETANIPSVNTLTTTKAYLKIVPVEVYGPKGKRTIHALLDEGSTITLLEEEIANEIGADGPRDDLHIEGIGGQRIKNRNSRRLQLRVKGLYARHYQDLQAYTIEDLQLSTQAVRKQEVMGCSHLKDVIEEITYDTVKPALLIGQDNWHLIVSRDIRSGRPNKPAASLTKLGWVLHGCNAGIAQPIRSINHLRFQSQEEDKLEDLIKAHFSIESMGVAPKKPTNDPEERALQILEKTCKPLPDQNRYECGLLWKNENETMPESKKNAMKRFVNLEKRLKCNKAFKEEYSKQINNLLQNGYAETAPFSSASPRTWYLPHFAVTHPQKKKMRLVFDAAAKSNGKSLNDALLSGPDLLQSLFGVLLRFREGPIAVMADIKEMFLRVKIREDDSDSQRFLWRNDDSEDVKEYRMTSLIFGATSSPCSAIFAKNKNAEREAHYPEAIKAIKSHHYMDDYLQSFYDASTAKRIASEVDAVHKKGGFELRGWASNDPATISHFPETQVLGKVQLGGQESHVEKTLGLRWNIGKDTLGFTVNLRNVPEEVIAGHRPPTKREVTSAVMSVFDPLGLACPVLVQGKQIIQDIWRTGIGWDEPLKSEEEKRWSSWIQQVRKLSYIEIPRCVSPVETKGELHTFCDASEKAFAAAIYWRYQHADNYEIKLIAAKSRVSPNKTVSIPRLELQAALLGSRLAQTVQQEIGVEKISRRIFWSDSRTALAWIKSDPRTFKTYVAHRIAEIEELTRQSEWRWTPTKENVADDATRDPPAMFDENHRWFRGPQFLRNDENEWPTDREKRPTEPTGEERVTAKINIAMAESALPEADRFSTWERLLRATARLFQCIEKFKLKKKTSRVLITNKKEKDNAWRKHSRKAHKNMKIKNENSPKNYLSSLLPPLGIELLQRAEKELIKLAQRENFRQEISDLSKQRQLRRDSRLHKLNVELREGVLTLNGRVAAADYLSRDYVTPIVLDGRHKITKLLIDSYHRKFNHANHNTVMNELRQRYFILSLRTSTKAILNNCQWCRTRKKSPRLAPFGNLPAERLALKKHPFTHTGVDYFGPMTITVGRRREKRWGVLFTCLTTRAIHLELAPSLSTNSMILALRRMSSRRGTPQTMYSDNGTNFVGANKELAEYAENRGMQWKFTPPGAPHMNGVCERLVRSVKTALAATLKERAPNEETLHTLLLEAEHIINSRPLNPISLEADGEESLTPNHFLIGRSHGAPAPGNFDDGELIGSSTWRTAQRLTDHFWKRWLKEYLPTVLASRQKTSEYQNPAVGDIVLIADATLPRGIWPRGEIVKIYPGPDNNVRVADVRTAGGIFKRPASRLVIITKIASEENGASTKGETVGNLT